MSRRRAFLGAAALSVVLALGAGVASAATAPRPILERGFEAAMQASRWETAATLADSLVRAREAAERLPPDRSSAVFDSLGRRLFLAGSPEAWAAAERLFRAGLARRERAFGPDDPRVASSLATLSTLLDYLGRWSDAVPLAERAVSIRLRALGETSAETAASLRQLGLLWFQLGEFERANEPLVRSLAIYAALTPGDPAKVADGHNNLGELWRVRDRLDSAETHLRLGLGVARAHLPPDDPVRLGLQNNLAGLFKDTGRFDEAEPLLESGLTTFEAAGNDPEGLATARLNLAEVRRLQDRPAEAAPLYALALQGARAALGAGHPGLVMFLNQSAVCEQQLGHFARAESLYAETAAIVEATLGPEHLLLAQNLHDRARLRLDSGRPREADSLLARALALRERDLGPRHPDVALILVDQARSRALESREASAVAEPLARAIGILDSTAAYPDTRLEAYAQRAEWNARAGRTDAAIADMAVALAAVDSLRTSRGGGDETRAAFLAGRLGLVDRMVGWQLERGDVAGALATHERGRARVLLDQIEASGVDIRAGLAPDVLAPLAAAERAAEARLAAAHRAIQDARTDPSLSPRGQLEAVAAMEARRDSASLELALVRRRIQDASPVWRAVLSAEGRTAGVPELQREVVPHDGLLLVYHVGRSASHVFVLGPRGAPLAWPLELDADAAAVLGEAAGPLREAALERIVAGRGDSPGIATLLGGTTMGGYLALPLRSTAAPDSFELRLHALWRTLVPARLRPRLRAGRTAVVVPDGALPMVAFEALVTRPSGRAGPVRYWLDDGPALAYGPSATSLQSLARRPRRPVAASDGAPVLSVSDVAYAAAGDATAGTRSQPGGARVWPPLPGTALESDAIRAAFGDSRVDVIRGAAAREGAVRAALTGRRYLHLATHGFADVSGDRVSAGLVFAPPAVSDAGSEDDGVLESFEVHRLGLACDLAMLSACETSRGPRVAGEGAFALSRAFLAAGAGHVVGSLWVVNDRPSAVVAGGLFERIAAAESRGRSPDFARALRDAKLEVRRDPRWADPFYWAPFVLSGR